MNFIKHFLLLFACCCTMQAQQAVTTKTGMLTPQRFKGYPDRRAEMDVLPGFRQPPRGYGNVPFFWWNGDRLTRERLDAELDILSSSATDGFAISYVHTDPQTDSIFNRQHGLFGKTDPGDPPVYSDEWWKIFRYFSKACAEHGLGVGMDDYTMGWTGNGYYPDELKQRPGFATYRGELLFEQHPVEQGERFDYQPDADFLTAVAYPGGYRLDEGGALTKAGKISWRAPETTTIYIVKTKPGYLLHPEHGKALCEVYFDRFEQRLTPEERVGLNYFFQDELSYPITLHTWADDLREEFQRRKGYDILPLLPALESYIGSMTPKVRMDYAEVLMDLAEERFFKPLYQWHADRGLIYGCDNLERGMKPDAYLDYFRAVSWYTAPGNDAPSKGSSFLQAKVSSSIAHLYNRPRTWLEAFHSMGWGSSGEWLTEQIDHHFMAGGNLVCMHGLYYTTHGSWWEWAPPCFHFRMPYWPHMKQWLRYVERMSYLLSQGDHVCDVALLYPTEPVQAYADGSPDRAFQVALQLSEAGVDYDFADFRSLREAKIEEQMLQMMHEKYKIIVMAGMRAVHSSTLRKMRDFYRAGGIVLATGGLPEATSDGGEGDPEAAEIFEELFGMSVADARRTGTGQKQSNTRGGLGWYVAGDSLQQCIPHLIVPDFLPTGSEGGKVLHRHVGARDVYMVTNVNKDTECFFRAKGKVELWNATDGTTQPYPIVRQDQHGTWLKIKKEYTNSSLIVFTPGEPSYEGAAEQHEKVRFEMQYDGEWNISLQPTMNNKWGDFRLPAADEMIGAEARFFRHAPLEGAPRNWMDPSFDDSAWEEGMQGYGLQAETRSDSIAEWRPVAFSWRYGVWDEPGSQGYHGLKSKVSDGFFILSGGGKQEFRTAVYAPKSQTYRLEQVFTPADQILIDGKEMKDRVRLEQGWHKLLAVYEHTPRMDFEKKFGAQRDFRPRGAVVLVPEDARLPQKPSIFDDEIAMTWRHADHLFFDPAEGRQSEWCYRFEAAPGLESFTLAVRGTDLQVWVAGEKLSDEYIVKGDTKDGITHYEIRCPERQLRASTVAFSLRRSIGYQGTAAIAEPVRQTVGEGIMLAGDWSKNGTLRCYSGGILYSHDFDLPDYRATDRVMLSLGSIVATAEVRVNGTSQSVLMSPPYQVDITSLLHSGTNRIEVLVYSTLANHYQTVPTPYRGDPRAGLLGPVRLSFY